MNRDIRKISVNDIVELGNCMYMISGEELQTVSIVMLRKDAINLIKWLACYEDIVIGNIDIRNGTNFTYDEYYITLDSNLTLSVVPFSQIDDEDIIFPKTRIILYDKKVEDGTGLKESFQHNMYNIYELTIENERDDCDNCFEDCSNCSHSKRPETFVEGLSLIEYIFDHID